MCAVSASMTRWGRGCCGRLLVLLIFSVNVRPPFWFTTIRPNVSSLRSTLISQTRSPIASFQRGPTPERSLIGMSGRPTSH